MTDFKFDILYAPKAAQSELDKVMEKYINAEPPYSKGELAEIRKREANNIKENKARAKAVKEKTEVYSKKEKPKTKLVMIPRLSLLISKKN